MTDSLAPRLRIQQALAGRHRFLITSHASPDGDSVGSQVAMARALEMLGKSARIVNRDPVPTPYAGLPGVERIEVAETVDGAYDAVIVMECTDLARPRVAGLEPYFLINIDHHVGNTGYGAVNWFDPTAAACGEMVSEIIDGMGVEPDLEIATHIYLCILTDTGSFRHSNVTARTFEICRRMVEVGVDPTAMSRIVFDNGSLGRLKLIGVLLNRMNVDASGRVAVLHLESGMLEDTGCTSDDTEGLVNLPLSARQIRAVLFLKNSELDGLRVSLRSKDDIDVRQIATRHGGGGHKNAAGFTTDQRPEDAKVTILKEIVDAIDPAHADCVPPTTRST